MAKYIIDSDTLVDLANAIREKTGETEQIEGIDMPAKVRSIETIDANLGEKTITENGTYLPSDDEVDGYSSVTVNVPEKEMSTKTITENGTYSAEDDDVDGYSEVTVNVEPATLSTKTITQNGSYSASADNVDGYSNIVVNVPASNLDGKTITENGTYQASDDNLDGYSAVNVNIPTPTPPTLIEKTITENGTYSAEDDNADGYSEVTVNTPAVGDLLKLLENNSSDNKITLTDDLIKSSATKLRANCFYKLFANSITLDDILEIGSYAFGNAQCGNISFANCKTVKSYAFTSATVGTVDMGSVETIEAHAFDSTYFPNQAMVIDIQTCKVIGDSAFYNCRYGRGNGKILLRDVESIGPSAFLDSWLFTATGDNAVVIDLPYCKTIGANAFDASYASASQCSSFKSVTLSRVESIQNRAFRYCRFLDGKIYIGPYITYLKSPFVATDNFTSLSITIDAIDPPQLENGLAGSSASYLGDLPAHIYVPAESVETYKAASVWSYYASVIEAIPN